MNKRVCEKIYVISFKFIGKSKIYNIHSFSIYAIVFILFFLFNSLQAQLLTNCVLHSSLPMLAVSGAGKFILSPDTVSFRVVRSMSLLRLARLFSVDIFIGIVSGDMGVVSITSSESSSISLSNSLTIFN